MIIYGVCVVAMLTVSGIYHLPSLFTRDRRLLRRLDHATILVAIAGTYTGVIVLGMSGATEAVLLVLVWLIAGDRHRRCAWCGSTARPSSARSSTSAAGWFLVVHPVAFVQALDGARTGVARRRRAALHGRRGDLRPGRPNPWPATFGFHEVWHACVVAAAFCHWVEHLPARRLTSTAATASGLRLDELEVEVDLDDVAEERPERTEAEAEVLAAQLSGRLEAGMTGAVDEVGDPAELDGELRSAG